MPAQILDRPGESLAEQLAGLDEPDRQQWIESFTDEDLKRALEDWDFWARPAQKLPPGSWYTWLILSGRGFGKTLTGAQTCHLWARNYPRIALCGPSAGDVRDAMIEGETGILNSGPKDWRPHYEPSKRRLTWPNGSIGTTFGAGEDPEELRGPQFYKAWCDELAAWQYAKEGIEMLDFGLRLGDQPQRVITTTPKPKPVIKELIKRDSTVLTKGSSMENVGNLSPVYFAEVIQPYIGTRLGRQEIYAEILDDVPGALWTTEMIERNYRAAPDLNEIVVAADPSVTEDGNECGIIVAGRSYEPRAYVLDDRSGQMSPLAWGKRLIVAYQDFNADKIIAEANNGGELVRVNVQMAALAMGVKMPPFDLVYASRGKRTRAEPVAALYEQDRASHLRPLPELEDQLTTWVPTDDSPDRLDALVWAVTYLMIDQPVPVDDATIKAMQAMQVHER